MSSRAFSFLCIMVPFAIADIFPRSGNYFQQRLSRYRYLKCCCRFQDVVNGREGQAYLLSLYFQQLRLWHELYWVQQPNIIGLPFLQYHSSMWRSRRGVQIHCKGKHQLSDSQHSQVIILEKWTGSWQLPRSLSGHLLHPGDNISSRSSW